jgi:hypothetical protein
LPQKFTQQKTAYSGVWRSNPGYLQWAGDPWEKGPDWITVSKNLPTASQLIRDPADKAGFIATDKK